jgi:RHS repeat-associated protein
VLIRYPATSTTTYFVPATSQPDSGWFGTITTQDPDGSGELYKRNRYYDPTQGRFTQEDPVGLAGGLNAYGFAAGDPINYSDPFGLCPHDLQPGTRDAILCSWIEATLVAAGTDIGASIGGGAGLLTGPGAVVASPAGALVGAGVGATLGLAAGGKLTDWLFSKKSGGASEGPRGSADEGAGARAWLKKTNDANPGLNRIVAKWFKEGGELPKEISREYLERYRAAAQDAIDRGIDTQGVQAQRIQRIDQVLGKS